MELKKKPRGRYKTEKCSRWADGKNRDTKKKETQKGSYSAIFKEYLRGISLLCIRYHKFPSQEELRLGEGAEGELMVTKLTNEDYEKS